MIGLIKSQIRVYENNYFCLWILSTDWLDFIGYGVRLVFVY